MDRRAFVTGLGAVLAAPLVAAAQPTTKVYRVGFLVLFPVPDHEGLAATTGGIRERRTSNFVAHRHEIGLRLRNSAPTRHEIGLGISGPILAPIFRLLPVLPPFATQSPSNHFRSRGRA